MTSLTYGRTRSLAPSRATRLALWSRRLGTLAFPLAVIGTAFHRTGAAEGTAGLAVLGVILACALAGLLLGLLAFLRIWNEGNDGTRFAVIGVIWSLTVLIFPASLLPAFFTLPRLWQATTDFTDPPTFVWSLRARGPDARDSNLMPSEQKALQSEAYPTVVPLRIDLPPPDAYALALQLVEARGWQILDRKPPQNRIPGRIEAVARTPAFGFRDDVVIRVSPVLRETRIDMRSASRLGAFDFGTNAKRIVEFLTEMRDRAVER